MNRYDESVLEYLKNSLTAKIGILIILACWFYLPHSSNQLQFSFLRFCTFAYCLLCAAELFLMRVIDLLLPVAYIGIAMFVQPFYKFFDFFESKRVHGKMTQVFNGDNANIMIYCGWILLALLAGTYFEKKYRRK